MGNGPNTAQHLRDRTFADPNSGCWLWEGYTLPGKFSYGVTKVSRRSTLVHRAMWALVNGEIPAGTDVLHRCDTPACCNPDHLFLGDQAANMRDCGRKGRTGFQRMKGCQAGENNYRAKLTWEIVGAIRDAAAAGLNNGQIARKFGVGREQARDIVLGKRWKITSRPVN